MTQCLLTGTLTEKFRSMKSVGRRCTPCPWFLYFSCFFSLSVPCNILTPVILDRCYVTDFRPIHGNKAGWRVRGAVKGVDAFPDRNESASRMTDGLTQVAVDTCHILENLPCHPLKIRFSYKAE